MARAAGALMYAGHIAAGLALKAAAPRAPTWALVLGAGWLDIVHGALVLVGVERVRPDPAKFLGWELVDMPWTHSLAAAIAWSVVAAVVFSPRGRRVAIVMAVAVFSHFALDFPMHEHDLALAPGLDTRLGLSLWSWSAAGAWAIEGAVVAAGLALYLRAKGVWTVVALVAAMHVSFWPSLSPVRMAGERLSFLDELPRVRVEHEHVAALLNDTHAALPSPEIVAL